MREYFWSWTHCGLVTPYGNTDLAQQWRKLYLAAWRQQALLVWFGDIYLEYISGNPAINYHIYS